MNTAYRLHYAPDNASLIIRLALEELGVAYDTVLVNRRQQAQRSPAYLRLNPNGLIPVLETPDGPIFETAAILLWLGDRHGKLVPSIDHPDRGDALKWLFFTSNTLHTSLRMLFYPDLYVGPDPTMQAQMRKMTAQNTTAHLQKLNSMAEAAPDWLWPDGPSALALYLGPLLRWCALYPKGQTDWFDLSNTPALADLCQRLESRPSTLAAIQAEGLGPTPFTNPTYANPPEGSAT